MPTILAIDDRQDNLFSLSALLKSMIPGCRVVTALSGTQGLEKVKTDFPDIILLDINMPVMDGFEVCQILKSDAKTKNIPVVMLTAVKTSTAHRVKALETGADAFLTKPVDESELVAQIKAMLRIKYAEDMIRQKSEILEQQVAERTAELVKNRDQLISEIEERRLTEEALKESEVKYRSMMESITDQLYICSPEFKVEYMNPAMVKRLGRDATGETCHKAIQGLDHRCEGCVFDRVAKGESFETTTTSPLDGRTYRITNMPMKNQNNTISKISIYRDITGYLKAVADKDKAEAKLLQSMKMESIGLLAGGIAHDFNNVLFPIIGFTQMSMEELPKNHPIQENLQDILGGANRARDLVKKILLFSRQEKQKLESIIIRPVIEEVIELLRSTIPANIDIQTQIYDGKDCILCDETEIHEIVMNLCTNAYHAIEDIGGKIKVSLKKMQPDPDSDLPSKEYICLSVSDNGVGIPKKIIDKIFEPYYTTKGVGKGTGMGLSVVHGIVKSYKGDIQVHSSPEEGTVFNIFLPVATKTIEIEQKEEKEISLLGTEKILVVDDEKPIVKLVVKALEKKGYTVTGMLDSTEALTLFKSKPENFDLVITDMAMPGMEGTQLAQKIYEIRPDIPIIVCSGFSEKIDHEKVNRFNIKAFIDKPILVKDLAIKVREILDQSNGGEK